ncbi:molybdenum cofactor guanylyltransferase MobA [Bathymodiolus septemdierum thioautotrophic gill symbiont]|uniref:Molybdenum cofactor guanylyltransferase n=1 Tax=endosymbiont of Bathymodiolus septemdierum str. Myojin knoll TaxID=1303921 RepID=A0A0N7KBH6_9GAMM|nr:molybdenum cofactor guanylyltransferase MobA [Bathymodiolus septemdierum thioautotrophic gill symbiont]BAS68039.1 molybdopterin-guanine dinucleotide biosynthesis protein A [endosymbiont of Bathymodiolus septemdierum str. Myojin knoll]
MKSINKSNITAVILSGGQGLRMNQQDKGLIPFNDKPMIAHIIDVVKPKVSQLFVSANRNIEKYQRYGEVITDGLNDFQGPLAGISKALSVTTTPYLLILPCDSPLVTASIIQRLIDAMSNNDIDLCVADDGSRMHPTIAIIKTQLKDNLLDFLESGDRKLGLWIQQNNSLKVDFSDCPEVLTNFNSPEDMTNDVVKRLLIAQNEKSEAFKFIK